MKTSLNKKLAMLLTLVFMISVFSITNTTVTQAAASPTLTKKTLEFDGTGETYDLNINNKVAKSKYSWTTSNATIATVKSNGLVTSVGSGIATIKCKITYPSKKTKILYCKVTVAIPATDISISNANLENGAQVLALGSSFDFDTVMTPANSTYRVYWSIGEEGAQDVIRIDDAEKGKITAIKAGKATLRATEI
jgi:hypothetical protein